MSNRVLELGEAVQWGPDFFGRQEMWRMPASHSGGEATLSEDNDKHFAHIVIV